MPIGERAVERAHRVGLVALDQDAAGHAGAERDLGDQEAGAAEQVFPHHSLLEPLAALDAPHVNRDSVMTD